jgi:hypothetical protein
MTAPITMKAMSIIVFAARSGALTSQPNMPIATSVKKRTTIRIDATRLIRQRALGIKNLVETMRVEELALVKSG